MTCADHRSIFDLCPSDDAFTGLREVLKQVANTDPALEGMYGQILLTHNQTHTVTGAMTLIKVCVVQFSILLWFPAILIALEYCELLLKWRNTDNNQQK